MWKGGGWESASRQMEQTSEDSVGFCFVLFFKTLFLGHLPGSVDKSMQLKLRVVRSSPRLNVEPSFKKGGCLAGSVRGACDS